MVIIRVFPVCTGIYRHQLFYKQFLMSVPCVYRDIPRTRVALFCVYQCSLCVQGYTVKTDALRNDIDVFPVCTGVNLTYQEI
jgi:hypothetical protein